MVCALVCLGDGLGSMLRGLDSKSGKRDTVEKRGRFEMEGSARRRIPEPIVGALSVRPGMRRRRSLRLCLSDRRCFGGFLPLRMVLNIDQMSAEMA